MRYALAAWLGFTLAACGWGARSSTVRAFRAPSPAGNTLRKTKTAISPFGISRTLRVLTYNVAGLPQWLSKSRPRDNLPRIGGLINDYDLVLAQEDFAYPDALRHRARFRQQTHKSGRHYLFNLGDGLSRFAKHPFAREVRAPWRTCSGRFRHASDCLANKGFSVATHVLSNQYRVDVYNVHLDAGSAQADIDARKAQVEQLIARVQRRSMGRAVILAGDTNLRVGRDTEALRALIELSGCRDTCQDLGCGRPDSIDRVFYRSSSQVLLQAVDWRIDPRFVDRAGRPLSDHEPIAVTFRWKPRGSTGTLAAR